MRGIKGQRAGAPFLRQVRTIEDKVVPGRFPFTIPAFRHGIALEISTAVTFFVGENGSGKSTLLEAIAYHCGFHLRGGSRNQSYAGEDEVPPLADALRLSFMPKVTQGFFLRAESFFDFASYLDELARSDPRAYAAYGGRSLHGMSHGESFLALFLHRLGRGIYILDEPEAALSPQRQLTLLRIIHDLAQTGDAQFVVASHSPILLAYPGAAIVGLDGEEMRPLAYAETEQYRLVRDFLQAPQRYTARGPELMFYAASSNS